MLVYIRPSARPHEDEVRLAKEASKKYGKPEPTIFSKIVDKTIPADIIHEDDKVCYRPQAFRTFD